MNNKGTFQSAFIMLFGALILQLFPVASDWGLFKPNFLLLMMVAWILYFPEKYGIEFAILMGIIADFIFSTPLGYHVLTFSICGLILIFFHRIVVYLQFIHRIILVFMMIMLFEFMQAAIDATLDNPLYLEGIFSLAIISALCWIPMDKFVARIYLQQK